MKIYIAWVIECSVDGGNEWWPTAVDEDERNANASKESLQKNCPENQYRVSKYERVER
jgi:hypothetical protein